MALTKVTGHVVLPTTNIEFHNTKSTGIVTFTNSSNATSSTTGALQVTGGVGIVKDLFVGGNITVGGTITYDDVTNIDSLGIITARNNIHLEDYIYHRGDLNTSVGFPSNDTIDLTTAGSPRIRIASDGKIGINTTDTSHLFTVFAQSGNSTLARFKAFNGNSNFDIFTDSSSHGQANVKNNIGATKVKLHSNGDSYFTGGSVGIGTESAATKLHVDGGSITIRNGTAAGVILDEETGVGGSLKVTTAHGSASFGPGNSSFCHLQTSVGSFYFNRRIVVDEGIVGSYNEDLRFDSPINTARMYVKSATGYVGINTSDPSDLLDVFKKSSTAYDETADDAQRTDSASITVRNDDGTTNSFSQLVFDTAGTNQSIARIVAIRSGTSSNHLAFVTEHNNTKSEKLRITSSGAVGINTTVDASTKLQVQTDATSTTAGENVIARFQSNGSGRDATIQLSDNVANSATISMLSSALILKQSGTETVRVTGAGEVGIGTDTPYTALSLGKWSDYSNGDGNTYWMPAGKWASVWNEANDIYTNVDYWVGFNGGYHQSGQSVNIALSPNRGNLSAQQGMYISGEATGNSTADVAIGKILGGDSLGRGTSGGTNRATKSELFRFSRTGEVGIGTDNPNEKLHIRSGTTGNSKIVLEADHNAAENGMFWVDEGNNTQTEFYYEHAGNKQHLKLNGNGFEIYSKQTNSTIAKIGHGIGYNEFIVPNGNVGIGTDDPGARLDVFGNLQKKDSSGLQNFFISDSGFKFSQSVSNWTSMDYTSSPVLAWDYKNGPGDMFYIGSGGNTAMASQMALVVSDGHGVKIGKSGYDGSDFDISSTDEFLRIKTDGEVLINGDGSGDGYLRIYKDRDTTYNSNGGNAQDLIIQQISDSTNTQGYSSLALQCNYSGQTGAWVALNAVRTGVGEADLTINPRNNSTGDVEKARFTSSGDLKFKNTQHVEISNTYTNGSLTIGGNVGSGAYAVVKGASVVRTENYVTTGTDAWLERFTVNQHGTVLQPARHGDSIETKPGARYYVINGATPLDGDYDDNTYTPLMRCGHSWNGILTLWMSFNGTEFQNGARQHIYHCQGVYGYPSNSLKTQHNQNALGTGLASLELAYQNTSPGGGLPNYYFKVRGTWTSGNNQPYVLWSWAGFNSAYPYAL